MTRTWWAVAALLAIFAMHGLATHAGAAGPAAVTQPSAAHAGHTAGHTAGHASSAARSASPVDEVLDEVLAEAAAWAPARHADDHGTMQALGLCLAVLVTAAIALLGPPRTGPGVVALLPREAAASAPPAAAGHDLAPPDLHALSVLRC